MDFSHVYLQALHASQTAKSREVGGLSKTPEQWEEDTITAATKTK